jgi:nucleoside-diphosphate-sugar epimerase
MEITSLGGRGFVGSEYIKQFPTRVNERNDYNVHSKDVLYFISTITNANIYSDPFVDIDTNLSTLVKVLESWRVNSDHSGIFNFISSWFVYGYGKGFDEASLCNPVGFYSITKHCAEQLLKCYCDTFHLKYRILRLANVIGPGDMKMSAQKNVLQFIANQLKNNETVKLVRGGQFYRDYIHVSDCARAIHTAITEGDVNSVYNIGNGIPTLFADAVYALKRLSKSESEIEYVDGNAQSFSMSADKLQRLGYVPDFQGDKLLATLL